MASSVDYLEYVLDLLRDIRVITYKKMMGEYVLYKNGVVFGGIYDDRFLIKKTESLKDLGLKEVIPYPTSKGLYLVDTEDSDEIARLINIVTKDLSK